MFKKINRKNKKGFTLAELLIVVAIIGVLVAISIPIFTNQLEKSRDSVTLSNIRSAYAQCQAAYLAQDESKGAQSFTENGQTISISALSSGSQTITITPVVFKGTAKGLPNVDQLGFTVNGPDLATAGGTPGNKTLTFTYTTTTDASGNTSTTVELTNVA